MTSDANSITIAIDGYSSCGKSTLARDLARELNYLYIDSGAMYRAVTLFLIRNNIEPGNTEAVAQALEHIQIDFRPVQGTQHTFLNDEYVEEEIRGMEVSMKVRPVSAVSAVRRKMV